MISTDQANYDGNEPTLVGSFPLNAWGLNAGGWRGRKLPLRFTHLKVP